ncbi:(2Fe-2S) ferredoxin domain-containing protein [Halostella salina]|uniref:(2Fe-2S) ferredoxin domain-containing protein n=1 Tax=Halostella salina TaxID=1547897 RepID=UPI000EF79D81|nr:NADH-ubiquinone oxidoreductase-F iron-sulfur binding region domain-containing protein [Halostella salina]
MTELDTGGTTIRVTVGRRGGDDVVRAAREAAPDGVDVRTVGPTGLTCREPVLMATRDGRTAAYGRVTPSGAKGLVDALTTELLEPPAFAVSDDDGTGVPRPANGPFAVGERRTLARCGWVDPSDGSPVGSTAPAAVESTARDSGFRGRGFVDSADGPVVASWDAAQSAGGEPAVVVASDTDPDVAADRLLLESDPAAVVDAATAVADVVEASDVVVVTGEGDRIARSRVEAVAADTDRDVTVTVGTGAFDPDEEVMAAETVDDDRPTVVHTPRTLAGLRALVHGTDSSGGLASDRGAPETADDPGTRLVTVCGDADRATVELPTDAPLSTALDAVGEPSLEFACVGGRLGGLTRTLDVAANVDALTTAGLGTNGVVELFDDSRCPVAVAGRRTKFAREHGCGRCGGCRNVVPELHEQLRAVYDGQFDPDELRTTCEALAEMDCRVAAAAARPTRSALDAFEATFHAHAEGRCPTGECY